MGSAERSPPEARSGLSGALWPGHPKPLPDEILSSWLVRTAQANGLKVHTFTSYYWPNLSVWNRDIDSFAPAWFIEDLARRSGTSLLALEATCIGSFAGSLFGEFNPKAFTPLVRPLGIYHRRRLRGGMQFCPECLADGQPYYRRSWRIAITIACERHGRLLNDACPNCGDAVNFHRADLDDRDEHVARILTACSSCGTDLRRARPARALRHEFDTALEMQGEMLAVALEKLPARLGQTDLHPVVYFAVLRHLMQLIAAGPISSDLRRTLIARDTTIRWGVRKHVVEQLSVADRFIVLLALRRYIEDWPARFLDVGKQLALTASDLKHALVYLPFPLEAVIAANFQAGNYSHTPDEIRAAIRYMRKRGLPVTKASVSRMLGGTDVFRKRRLHRLLGRGSGR